MQQYDDGTTGGWFFSINEEKKAWGTDIALQGRGNESYKKFIMKEESSTLTCQSFSHI
jgi:hypothetical protein